MSVYPVKMVEWFPKIDEMYDRARTSVRYSYCLECNKKGEDIKYQYAIAHHSLPWGHGDVWCTTRCFNKWKKPRD